MKWLVAWNIRKLWLTIYLSDVQRLNQDNVALQIQFKKMEVRADNVHDQGRRNALRVCGIPEEASEN